MAGQPRLPREPLSPPALPPSPVMMLLQRVRQFARQHALFRADTRVVAGVVRRIGLGRPRGHPARARRGWRCASGRGGALQSSASRRRGTRRAVLSLRCALARRSRLSRIAAMFERGRGASAGRSRMRRGASATSSSSAPGGSLAPTSWRSATRATIRPKRFLLRLVRGAGPRGLAAMYPRHGTIVRPVLDCRRLELRRYLDERNMAYVDDETNDDVTIPRNRVRAELLPLLANRFNPAIVDVLAHEAELSRETWAWLEAAADDFEKGDGSLFRGQVSNNGRPRRASFRALDVARLKAAPPPLRRLVLWRTMIGAAGGRPVSFCHVDAALQLLESESGGVDAPGHRVERRGSWLVLTGRPRPDDGRSPAGLRHAREPFPVSAVYSRRGPLAEAGCIVAAELARRPRARCNSPRRQSAPMWSGRGPWPWCGATCAAGLWPCGTGAPETGSGQSASGGTRSCRTTSSTGKWPGPGGIACPWSLTNRIGLCG